MQPVIFSAEPLVTLDDAVTDVCWDDHGESFYVGLANGSVDYISKDGELLRHWKAHTGGVTRVNVSPDGSSFATAGEDGRVLLWDKQNRSTVELANEPVWVEQLEWNADGKVLAAAAGKSIYLWRGTESIGVWYDARRHIQAMAWEPAGNKLATATNKGLYLWRLGNDEPMELLAFPGAAVSVSWKPDGKALAVGTQDGYLQLWRQGKQDKSSQLTIGIANTVNAPAFSACHENMITAIAFSPDGQYLASADMNGRVNLCNPEGKCIGVLEAGVEITSLTWNLSGSCLLLGGIEGRLDTFYTNSLT